jgi:hypothetical protein
LARAARGVTPESTRHAGELVLNHVAALFRQQILARLGQHADRDLVPHHARRHEERRLESEHARRERLQPVDRRVLAVDVVADLGVRHRTAHLGGRLRDGVGAEIDHAFERETWIVGGGALSFAPPHWKET